jgi:hypothetical protein
MKGFKTIQPKLNKTKYWVSCYSKENEDDPLSIERLVIEFKQGENKDEKMLKHCYQLFKNNEGVWEVLVHKGVSNVPESGDQIVARLSREPFKDAEELTV